LGQAIQTWSYCLYTQQSITIEVCHALHQMAYVTLHLSKPGILDILVFAGYPSLVGRQWNALDYYRAERAIKGWSNSHEALLCVKHALLLVQEILFSRNHYYSRGYDPGHEGQYCARLDKIALRPWCLFVCTLVIWAFHCSHNSSRNRNTLPENCDVFVMTEQYIVSRLQALSSNQPLESFIYLEKYNSDSILCLISSVRSCLSGCRWEMLGQAYTCLGSLMQQN
jgi:hypothetical protein